MEIIDKLDETVKYIQEKIGDYKPSVAVILGSGLGALPDEFECLKIPYVDIPNFEKSSVKGHKGQLCFCNLNGKNIVFMQGRYHFYEGYTLRQITFPIKVLRQLGIEKIIITNAAGALTKTLKIGDLMLITDHINFIGNPLIGYNDERLGIRFPDMSNIYKQDLIDVATSCAKSLKIPVKKGIYMAMTGPSYETPAEVKMANLLGAKAVGMSTAPEAVVANYCGIDVMGISCITNFAAGISNNKLSHEEVIETTKKSEEKFKNLLKNILETI